MAQSNCFAPFNYPILTINARQKSLAFLNLATFNFMCPYEGFSKEKPDMPARSGTGTFDEKGNFICSAQIPNGGNVGFPTIPVKIHCQKITAYVFGHGIKTHNIRFVRRNSLQMFADYTVIKRSKLPVFAFRTLYISLIAKPCLPFVQTNGLIPAYRSFRCATASHRRLPAPETRSGKVLSSLPPDFDLLRRLPTFPKKQMLHLHRTSEKTA